MRLPPLKSGWMLVAGFLFSIMGVCVKLGSGHFSTAELVFYRSLFGLLPILAVALARRRPLRTPHWRTHLTRSVSGFIALLMSFYAIGHLPLATAISLNYTSALFVGVISVVWLKQRGTPLSRLALLLGFAGVVLLLRPHLTPDQARPALIGLVSGCLSAIAYLNIKELGQLQEPSWRTVYYFTLVCTAGAGAWMLLAHPHLPAPADLPVLLGMGLSATLAQLAMTLAWKEGQPLVVGTFSYSNILFASLNGWLLWQERVPLAGWAGIFLIILSGFLGSLPPRARA